MNKIVLISCSSQKQSIKSRAEDLYCSPLFQLSLKFAKQLASDSIFILSAKYGLVRLEDIIEPYDTTLNDMTEKDRKQWADDVLRQLRDIVNCEKDHFIILAGNKYRQYIIPALISYEVPLKGLTIGKQLQRLKMLSAKCMTDGGRS